MYGVTSGASACVLLRGQLADMTARGWSVTVVANGDEMLARAAEREGVRAIAMAMEREVALLKDLKSFVGWISLLKKEQPAVLNVGTPKAALLGALAGRLTGVPRRVYVVRGLRFEGTAGYRRRVLVAMERLTMWASTDVIVVSESVGRRMLEAGLRHRPLLLIGAGSSNGVDGAGLMAKAAAVDVRAARAKFGVPPDRFVVGFVGRLTLDKGIDVLANAMRILHGRGISATLLVVGEAEDPAANESLARAGVPVISTGWTEEPWRPMAIMDALVLPTKREGFPNVVLEANACGVPVITTRATGAVDAVSDGETGLLVDVDDAYGLANALGRLRLSAELRGALADSAQQRVLTEFMPERIWQSLDSIYSGQISADVSIVR